MTTLAYWIQRADFTTTDYDPVDVAGALRALDAHPWHDELKFQTELESAGGNTARLESASSIRTDHSCTCAPPPMVDISCTSTRRQPVSVLRPFATTVHTGEGMLRADVGELIQHFFDGQHARIRQALGAP